MRLTSLPTADLATIQQLKLYQYLQQQKKPIVYCAYLLLLIHGFLMIQHGIAYVDLKQRQPSIPNALELWLQSDYFLCYYLVCPLLLWLKVADIFRWRYLLYALLLLHIYPMFSFGMGFHTALLLNAYLVPILWHFEVAKT